MGMRAQVKIEDTGVYLYTHWGSEELPTVLQNILASDIGKSRSQDPEYLARIIFEAMIANGSSSKETGFGIGTTEHGDLEYPAIRVNCEKQTVSANGFTFSFDEFVKVNLDEQE